jgi:hypothetical protein
MANEAVIVELLGNQGDVVSYIVADGTGIEKGTLMYLSGDRTMSASSAEGQFFVGIASAEKVANDGTTTLGVYTNGIFDLKDAGAGITLGNAVKLGGANLIAAADEAGAQDYAEFVGFAMEAATGSEIIQVRVK